MIGAGIGLVVLVLCLIVNRMGHRASDDLGSVKLTSERLQMFIKHGSKS